MWTLFITSGVRGPFLLVRLRERKYTERTEIRKAGEIDRGGERNPGVERMAEKNRQRAGDGNHG